MRMSSETWNASWNSSARMYGRAERKNEVYTKYREIGTEWQDYFRRKGKENGLLDEYYEIGLVR